MPIKVYRIRGTRGYELCHPEDSEDFERLIQLVAGVVHGPSWVPIQMKVVKKNGDALLLQSDSPWLGTHCPILRKRAVERLDRILHSHGELLPLVTEEGNLSAFNCTRVVDALDRQASSLMFYKSGKLMGVRRYAFKLDQLDGIHIFKIPDLRSSPTFVDEEFVHQWRQAELVGLDFYRTP